MDDLQLIKVINEKIKLDEKIDENLRALINLNNLQELFYLSCKNGYKKTALWLYELSKTDGNTKININACDDEAFRWSCLNGHTKTALWLYELSKTDGNTKIHINTWNDEAFRWSYKNGHKRTAVWLCSLYPKYKFTINKKNKKNKINLMIITDNSDDIDKYAFEYNIQMLLLNDGYLKVNNKNNEAHNESKRFYQIIEKLPFDLTQKMSYILCGSTKTIIKSSTFNRLFNNKN